MVQFMYLEVNVICGVILLVMLHNLKEKKLSRRNLDQFIFQGLVASNILIILFDSGMWLLNGATFYLSREMHLFVVCSYYILNPLICWIWLIYTDYKINRSRKYLLKRLPQYSIPFFVNVVLALLSIKTDWLFSVSENNMYTRGPLFVLMALCGLCYLAYAMYLTLKELKRRDWEGYRQEFYYFIIFPVTMIIVSAFQIFFYGLSIIWAATTLLLTIIFVNVQKNEISTDYLTGLNNRRTMDNLLSLKINKHRKDSRLFLALIDVDDFKMINDTFGHNVGDLALIQIASILKHVCKDPDDLIVRLGGDEFLIAGERDSIYEIEYLRNDLMHRIERYNNRDDCRFHLSLSVGFALLGGSNKSAQDLINEADQRMYANKQTKKQR